MIRIFSFTVLLLATLVLCHCSCGEDVILGTIDFNGATNDFKVYSNNNVIRFEDSLGIIKSYEVSSYNDTFNGQIVVGTICNESMFNNAYAQYNYTGYEVYLNSGPDFIHFYLSIQNLNHDENTPGDTVMIDQFFISSVINGDYSGFNLITNFRGHEGRVSEEQRNQIESYRYVADTILLGQSYSDLYFNTDSLNQIYFKPAIGVVALVVNGNPFVLKQ